MLFNSGVFLKFFAGFLLLYWLVRNTPFRFLFERPAWARVERKRAPVLQPAE